MQTGGELLVACLKAQGVDRVFTVPGESYLAVLDGLRDSGIENVVARQEGGAAMMAEADGKLTGRPGIAMVTRGPGACNASSGVHVAKQDSTPMILFVGQIGRAMRGREAFQEVDYRAMFSGLAKWVEEIDDAARIPEIVSHAYHIAMSGRPGPVVLSLPEDMLRESASARPGPFVEVAAPAPDTASLGRFREMLEGAKRPLVVVGGSRWSQSDVEKCQDWAARLGLPVAASFRRVNLFDNLHPNYIGEIGFGPAPHLKARLDQADLLILLGCRFSETPSQGFSALGIPKPQMPLVHIHPGPEELGRIYAPDLSINAAPGAFLDAAADLEVRFDPPAADHAAYLAHSEPTQSGKGIDNAAIQGVLEDCLGPEAIVTNGAGNYAIWVQRFRRYRRFESYLGPVSGSMGYGLPAAIAAKARFPERPVVACAGDGCFQMTMQEFGTAAQMGLDLTVLVFDNRAFGTIRLHQERRYPGRVSGTELVNPDFAELAQTYGCYGRKVDNMAAFETALREAVQSPGPALIHIENDPDVIAPDLRLSGLV